jgi:hypothetical protein
MELIKCPICSRTCRLGQDLNDIFIPKINSKITVNFFFFECDTCKESFTDTEIDEKNVENISNAIRTFKRKNKIQDIIKNPLIN